VAIVLLGSVAIVAYLDATNVFHAAADEAITRAAREDRLSSSAVNYAELLTGAELGHHDEQVVRGFFSELVSEVAPVGLDVAERAAELRGAKKSPRLPDALVLATADLHADVLLGVEDQRAKIRGFACELRLLRPPAGLHERRCKEPATGSARSRIPSGSATQLK
jgi:predicted nucleic acid-binding protein